MHAAGTSSEESRSPPLVGLSSGSSSGDSVPISPVSPGGFLWSSPLSPLCNDHPITQLHLQTDFELYRLEQELGSSAVPDPLAPDPIFEEDFAAVMESLETTDDLRRYNAAQGVSFNCSFCSDISDVEISARALDFLGMEPPVRLQGVRESEDESVTLFPAAEHRAADAADKEEASSPDGNVHPFLILKEPALGVAEAGEPSPSPTEVPKGDLRTSNSVSASDDSDGDLSWLARSLPGHSDPSQDPRGFLDDISEERKQFPAQDSWALGVLAAVLSLLGGASASAKESTIAFVSLMLACHMPGTQDESSHSQMHSSFFNHVYIIHHLWGRSRREVLNDSYYDSECSSGTGGEQLSSLLAGKAPIRNPLFCMQNLPPPSPRSPRARVPLPVTLPEHAGEARDDVGVEALGEIASAKVASGGAGRGESLDPGPSEGLTGSSMQSDGLSSSLMATTESSFSVAAVETAAGETAAAAVAVEEEEEEEEEAAAPFAVAVFTVDAAGAASFATAVAGA